MYTHYFRCIRCRIVVCVFSTPHSNIKGVSSKQLSLFAIVVAAAASVVALLAAISLTLNNSFDGSVM